MASPPSNSGAPPASAPKGVKRGPLPANPRFYAQRRKVLAKHYRTKYGVRQRLRGRKP